MYLINYFYNDHLEGQETDTTDVYETVKTIKELKAFLIEKIRLGYNDKDFKVFQQVEININHKIDIKITKK